MRKVDDLPDDIKGPIKALFKSENYCFATTAAKRKRTPTFYFAQGGLDALNSGKPCGRLRTQHPSGTRIDITNNEKRHLFFEDYHARDAAHDEMPGLANTRAALDAFVDRNRKEPRDGDFHLEFTMVATVDHQYSRRHRSQGTIVKMPRVPNDDICLAIVNYTLNRKGEIRFDADCKYEIHEYHTDQRSVADFLKYLSEL